MTTSSSSTTTEILLATILGNGDHLLYNHDFGTLPAFVELFFLDQMEHMIKSSANHLSSQLADMPGSSVGMLLISENFELIFTLVSFFVQFYSIEHNDASVIESLYGLQRRSVNMVQDTTYTTTIDSTSGNYRIGTVLRRLFPSNLLTGVRRYESSGGGGGGGLTPLQRLLSVHALTLVPYVIGNIIHSHPTLFTPTPQLIHSQSLFIPFLYLHLISLLWNLIYRGAGLYVTHTNRSSQY